MRSVIINISNRKPRLRTGASSVSGANRSNGPASLNTAKGERVMSKKKTTTKSASKSKATTKSKAQAKATTKSKAAAKPAESKPKKLSCLDAAAQVLKAEGK